MALHVAQGIGRNPFQVHFQTVKVVGFPLDWQLPEPIFQWRFPSVERWSDQESHQLPEPKLEILSQ